MFIEGTHDKCGSGPVILEDHDGRGFRAICCACWTHSAMKKDRKSAIEAWSKVDERKPWRSEDVLLKLAKA